MSRCGRLQVYLTPAQAATTATTNCFEIISQWTQGGETPQATQAGGSLCSRCWKSSVLRLRCCSDVSSGKPKVTCILNWFFEWFKISLIMWKTDKSITRHYRDGLNSEGRNPLGDSEVTSLHWSDIWSLRQKYSSESHVSVSHFHVSDDGRVQYKINYEIQLIY